MAFFLVALTEALHDGQVNGEDVDGLPGGGGGGREEGLLRDELSWKANHSFKQAPQKVWRQSRRVRGEWRTSVHIWEGLY